MSFVFRGKLFRSYLFQKQPPEVFYKKVVLKNFAIFTREQLCWSPETLTQEFSYEYCEDFKNNYFEEHLKTAATVTFQNYVPEHLKGAALHFTIFQFCLF